MHFVLPVLLSSVLAMMASQWLLGDIELFHVPAVVIANFGVDGFLACLLLTFFIICLCGLFFHVQKLGWRLNHIHFSIRFLFIGFLTAALGIYIPEVLGAGYDSISTLVAGGLLLTPVLLLLIAKVVLTSLTIGLGIPGGMIGPTFFIGGVAGVQVVLWVDTGLPLEIALPLFALLGMSAMMATCFQAPLAALIAVVEMTHSSEIMLPAMFVIGLSCLCVRVLLKQDSIFVERLHYLGLESKISSVARLLRRHPINNVSTSVICLSARVCFEQLQDLQLSRVVWVAILDGDRALVQKKDVLMLRFFELNAGPQPWLQPSENGTDIDLKAIGDWLSVEMADEVSSLDKILEWLDEKNVSNALVRMQSESQWQLVDRAKLNKVLLSG